MRHDSRLLELNTYQNTWTPPEIDEVKMAYSIRNDECVVNYRDYLYIFQTEPYIDSIYIEYDIDREPMDILRFTIHEGYVWEKEYEEFFHDFFVKHRMCGFSGGQLDKVYDYYNEKHPEWHLQRYLTKGTRLLDHIYNCQKENTAKEMLYKAGLDELAVNIDELDELNLIARKPSDLYDGLSMRVLRSVNCPDGAKLISDKDRRAFIKMLNHKFPSLFDSRLNDAQCRYMRFLIDGDLTIGEVGRLFGSRKPALSRIWTRSQYDTFMATDNIKRRIKELCAIYSSIDPIYENYIRNCKDPAEDLNIKQLEFYLLLHREEYDKAIRRSNRERDYDWMERGDKYYVRYPQTINDFCRESLFMQNCLLTYVEAVKENDTTILFMRKADDVNTPFITIEIYMGELIQAYHRFNEDCTKEEADWIRDYCERHGINASKFEFNADIDELF